MPVPGDGGVAVGTGMVGEADAAPTRLSRDRSACTCRVTSVSWGRLASPVHKRTCWSLAHARSFGPSSPRRFESATCVTSQSSCGVWDRKLQPVSSE